MIFSDVVAALPFVTSFGNILIADENVVLFTSAFVAVRVPILSNAKIQSPKRGYQYLISKYFCSVITSKSQLIFVVSLSPVECHWIMIENGKQKYINLLLFWTTTMFFAWKMKSDENMPRMKPVLHVCEYVCNRDGFSTIKYISSRNIEFHCGSIMQVHAKKKCINGKSDNQREYIQREMHTLNSAQRKTKLFHFSPISYSFHSAWKHVYSFLSKSQLAASYALFVACIICMSVSTLVFVHRCFWLPHIVM